MTREDGSGNQDESAGPTPLIGIFGVGHSGSTLLERCIASHPDCVGIGEVDETVRQARAYGLDSFAQCTCGVAAEACSVWSFLNVPVRDDDDAVLKAIMRATVASGRRVVVDSSKRGSQAERHLALQRNGHIKLVPVYLYRDFRSWVISRKVSRHDSGMGIVAYVRRSWNWMRSVMRGRRALAQMGVRPFVVRYEDFVRDPSSVLAPVFERAGLATGAAIDPAISCQHALKGNGMRLDPSKNSRIIVDDKWYSDWRTHSLAPLVFGPFIYNYILSKKARRMYGDRYKRGKL